MLGLRTSRFAADEAAAIRRSQAVIEFDLDGNILTANENFLRVVGYGIDEIKGRHHAIFVEPGYGGTEAYRAFWARLRQGEAIDAQFLRLGKGGRQVWLQAT